MSASAAPSDSHAYSGDTTSFPSPLASALTACWPAAELPDGFIRVEKSEAGVPGYSVFGRPIEKSESDDRKYRLLRLDNGLEVLLIADAKTDKAAASMNIAVGHLSDPENAQGLAHFCEHLLFMGTEKYPRENEYREYLSRNSGFSNASTGMDMTDYFFEVHPTALDGALDRFAQFFISPLFDPSCTEREVQAVHSENAKNLQSDMWRSFQLDKSTSSHNHAYWRFGTGNLETLWDGPRAEGRVIRDELMAFHRRHYSANCMKLAILGCESLDEMTLSTVRRFSAVPNYDIKAPSFAGSPYEEEQFSHILFQKMVQDRRQIVLSFPLTDLQAFYKTRPGLFISHFVGHEGAGSLLSFLKRRAWANGLCAGPGSGATGFELFKISIDLTKLGLDHYRDVILSAFSYLTLLRRSPPQEWAFQETARVQEIEFRFKPNSQPMSYVASLSAKMQKPYLREQILSANWLARHFDPKLIAETLALLTPDRCRVTVKCQEGVPGVRYDLKERWYGTEYALVPLDAALRFPSPDMLRNEELVLPEPNPFIPADLTVIREKDADPAREPRLVHESEAARVWHKKDDRWWLPRASVRIKLCTPLLEESALHFVMARLYTDLVEDALTEYAYDAHLAGLSYSFAPEDDSLHLSFSGFNDKLLTLATAVLKKIKELTVQEDRFEVLKEKVERGYRNFGTKAPYEVASYWMGCVKAFREWSITEKQDALKDITLEGLTAFVPRLLERIHSEVLVTGNLAQETAVGVAELVQSTLGCAPLPTEERPPQRSLVPARPSASTLSLAVSDPQNCNSAIDVYFHVGDLADDDLRTRLALYTQLAREPCFDVLRTKEQLGYLVWLRIRRAAGSCGVRVALQSERSPEYLAGRVEAFFEKSMTERLGDMPDEEFEREKASLITETLEDFKNGSEETRHYWGCIKSGYYGFTQHLVDAEAIKSLTKQDMLDFHHRYLHPASADRSKISVHLRSQKLPADEQEGCSAAEAVFDDAATLKASLSAGPPAQPWVPLGDAGSSPVLPDSESNGPMVRLGQDSI